MESIVKNARCAKSDGVMSGMAVCRIFLLVRPLEAQMGLNAAL
jgi:hypothetical protein